MNTLILYANYKSPSFNSAIRDRLGDTLNVNGHEVVIRDLYNIHFNPVLSKADLESIDDEIYPNEIIEEQKYITRADLIIFVYPIWWSGMPAILKGYIERVFLEGFAFKTIDGKPTPLLNDKKVMIFNTLGAKNFFNTNEKLDALNFITEQCIFEYCGMEVIEHKYFEGVKQADESTRQAYLDKVSKIASSI